MSIRSLFVDKTATIFTIVDKMETEFQFVEIPEEALSVLGEPDPGTRLYRKSGSHEESCEWLDVVFELFGNCVSPGGVCPYAHVSRAAVNRRIKEGRLTAFAFHEVEVRLSLFGKRTAVKTTPYVYIPVSEAKAWGKELEDRSVRLGYVSEEEIEGSKADWSQDFWEWHSKWREGLFKQSGKDLKP